MKSGYPVGNDRTVRHTVGRFVTRVEQQLQDGSALVFHSRWYRKGLPAVRVQGESGSARLSLAHRPWLSFWAPRRLAWWVALLFLAGAGCFALGAFASNWPPGVLSGDGDARVIGQVFFIGSLFFTAAAGLQLLEAVNGDITDIDGSGRDSRDRWRWFAWKPGNAGYMASLVQFAGTILFNANTADAMLAGLDLEQKELLIWAPDVAGSICFLLAGYLALVEVSHRWWSVQPHSLSWWIVIINLLGSLAFMASAVFSFYQPVTGDIRWLWGANLFTLIGALCFLLASYLLIPELFGAAKVTGDRDGELADGQASA